jgi:hypothetical protein
MERCGTARSPVGLQRVLVIVEGDDDAEFRGHHDRPSASGTTKCGVTFMCSFWVAMIVDQFLGGAVHEFVTSRSAGNPTCTPLTR